MASNVAKPVSESRIVTVAAEIKRYQLRRGEIDRRLAVLEAETLKLQVERSDNESKRLAAAREMDKLTE